MVTLMQNDYFNLARIVAFLDKYNGKVKFDLQFSGNYWHGSILLQKKDGSFGIVFETVDKELTDMMDYIGQYCLNKMMTPPRWADLVPRGIPAMHTEGAMERATQAAKLDPTDPADIETILTAAADATIDEQIKHHKAIVEFAKQDREQIDLPSPKFQLMDIPYDEIERRIAEKMPHLDMEPGKPWTPPENIELGDE
jgi:hypothetical protein